MSPQVDSMLRKRESRGEHEAMRKIKNEFMVNWDGLRTKDKERVLVLAATNRPFDLDEAVIRRLPRRCYHCPFEQIFQLCKQEAFLVSSLDLFIIRPG